MSWLFLFACLPSRDIDAHRLQRIHDTASVQLRRPAFYLAAGGAPPTCLHGQRDDGEGWAVTGVGIAASEAEHVMLDAGDWARVLDEPEERLDALDGHFAGLCWNDRELRCFVDAIGLRSLYFASAPDGLCVSTRLDWVARATGRHAVDFRSLEGRWTMYNQIGYGSGIAGIKRLGPGGRLHVRGGRVVVCRERNWLPRFEAGDSTRMASVLDSVLRGVARGGRTLSLGLSGGFDSRLLLAALASLDVSFRAHTFGDGADPDVRIALELARCLSVPACRFADELPAGEAAMACAQSYAAQTGMVEPVSAVMRLCHYAKIEAQGGVVIDGGFGEIARRNQMKRVEWFGARALRRGDASALYRMLRRARADIFAPDAAAELEDGSIRNLEVLLETMPPIERIGLDNYLDLIVIRTQLPNYGGADLARLDAIVPNLMPFVQGSFLRAVFACRPALRRNARFHRGVIEGRAPELALRPFVTAGRTYPYTSGPLAAWIHTSIAGRLNRGYRSDHRDRFLAAVREETLDLAHSDDVATWPAYDARKIRHAVTAYHAGAREWGPTVDWWLTFELWRRSMI